VVCEMPTLSRLALMQELACSGAASALYADHRGDQDHMPLFTSLYFEIYASSRLGT
jgi:hypothetical protein